MNYFKAKIISNKKIAPGHRELSFRAPKGFTGKTSPGQFFTIRVSGSYEPLLRRPFAAHEIRKKGITILYKVVGKATEILSENKKGDTLDILGPLGNGFNLNSAIDHRPSTIALVAGGHGVAPLYALASSLRGGPEARRSLPVRQAGNLIVFIGARSTKHIVCAAKFRALGLKVYIATEDGSRGYKGLVTDLLRRHCDPPKAEKQSQIYACGPKPMLKEVARIAKAKKIPCRVSLEEYMACGTGACLGCAVKTHSGYKLVCKDGPVFDSKEIIW